MIAAALNGAAAMAFAAIGLFFARFWHESRDRLFVCLTGGFWILAANYAILAALPTADARLAFAFLLRFLGLVAILAGICLKDREFVEELDTGDVDVHDAV